MNGRPQYNPGTLSTLERPRSPTLRRSRGAGALSLALGLARLTNPSRVAGFMGIAKDARSIGVVRVIGVRDLLIGVGLLARPKSVTAIWARVAGDVLDLALLATSMLGRAPSRRSRRGLVTAAALGMTAADTLIATRSTRSVDLNEPASLIHVRKTITINRRPEEVYAFWRDLENLPRFMAHLESVQVQNGRSTWRARGPVGTHVEWQAEVVQDVPNESIAWRSLEGALVPNRGAVRFVSAPGHRGTQLVVELKYDPLAGKLGALIARLFGEEPAMQIDGDLRRLKQILETGEVVHSDASIHPGKHPARPAKRPITTAKEANT